MSEITKGQGEMSQENAAVDDANAPSLPRIQIDVPMGTPYQEIQASVFRQAYQMAGTQLRAAIALGITPETVSRVLRRSGRKGIPGPRLPRTWPVVEPQQAGRPTAVLAGDLRDKAIWPWNDDAIRGVAPIGQGGISTPNSERGAAPATPGDKAEEPKL
jgi:hypothetical protein